MSALSEFQKQRSETEKARRESVREQNAKFRALDKDKAQYYQLLAKQLRSFNNQKVDGHKLAVKFKSKDCIAQLFVDKNHFATFTISLESSSCHCENACDCEVRYWHDVDVIIHRKEDDREAYFACRTDDLRNDKEFAAAMVRLMDEYDLEYYA